MAFNAARFAEEFGAVTLLIEDRPVLLVMSPPIAYPPNASPKQVAQAERTAWGRLYQWLQVNLDLATDGFLRIQDVLLCWIRMHDGRPAGEWFWHGVKTGQVALPSPGGEVQD